MSAEADGKIRRGVDIPISVRHIVFCMVLRKLSAFAIRMQESLKLGKRFVTVVFIYFV